MVNKPLIRPYFLGGVALGGQLGFPWNFFLPITLGNDSWYFFPLAKLSDHVRWVLWWKIFQQKPPKKHQKTISGTWLKYLNFFLEKNISKYRLFFWGQNKNVDHISNLLEGTCNVIQRRGKVALIPKKPRNIRQVLVFLSILGRWNDMTWHVALNQRY